jgi:glycosyltransferase involved in cell wall biosynthesis
MTEPFGIGGVQSDLLALSEEFSRRGHEVSVATTPGVLLDELKAKGARHVCIDFQYRGVRGLLQACVALRRAIRENRIELVAPQSLRSAIVAFLATRLVPCRQRVPLITTIHNIHDPRHFRYAGRVLQRCSDFVIFESNYERARVLDGGLDPRKSCVIHSGIDIATFEPRPHDRALAAHLGLEPGRHKIFGIVARLSEEKGHQYLLEAFARVHAADPLARLVVVGDGPLLPDVQRRAGDLGIAAAVVFTGMQRDVPAYLALFDVFVLASTRESFPLAAREAMASGKAVVAPSIGGCPEVVEHGVTGLLFEARNVGELARCMVQAVQDDRYKAFGEAGRARAQRLFSRRAWVDGDEAVYQRWRCCGSTGALRASA